MYFELAAEPPSQILNPPPPSPVWPSPPCGTNIGSQVTAVGENSCRQIPRPPKTKKKKIPKPLKTKKKKISKPHAAVPWSPNKSVWERLSQIKLPLRILFWNTLILWKLIKYFIGLYNKSSFFNKYVISLVSFWCLIQCSKLMKLDHLIFDIDI